MSGLIDWSAWVTAIATVVSSGVAYFMWRVSQKLYNLQKSVEAAKEPKVHIWFNGQMMLTPKVISSLSIVNVGQTALPIRTLRIIGQDGQAMKFLFSDELHGAHPKKVNREMVEQNLGGMPQVDTDIILHPNTIYQVFFQIQSGQFKVEVMYYDNSFEFIEIDTSNLGGKYILTGQGRN